MTQERAAGVHALPDGAASTRTVCQPDHHDAHRHQIHEIGPAEVSRLRAEMEAIKNEVGFKGDLPAFFAELRDNKDNPRYYYPNTDEGRQAYIKDATAAIDKIKAVLPSTSASCRRRISSCGASSRFASRPARRSITFRARPTAPGRRLLRASARHEGDAEARIRSDRVSRGPPGPPHADRDRAGVDAAFRPSVARQASPRIQRAGGCTPSGWRVKCPAPTRIRIRASDALARKSGGPSASWSTPACTRRVVRRAGGGYFLANSATTEAQARSEIRRYLVMPGQATSYKIGMLKIQELRRKAEGALGLASTSADSRCRAGRRRAAVVGAREPRRPMDRDEKIR